MTPLPYTMIEATLSYLAWFSVVLFQAIVHFWILDSRKRTDDDCVPLTAVDNDTYESKSDPQQLERKTEDDPIPRMVPHTPLSEDEEEDESFDGDEPKVFFELLEQTGSEMMKVRTKFYIVSCKLFFDLTLFHRNVNYAELLLS